jgi:hypothetical protein
MVAYSGLTCFISHRKDAVVLCSSNVVFDSLASVCEKLFFSSAAA